MAMTTVASSLAQRWFEPFENAVHHLLATRQAELAFAQVIDAYPLLRLHST